MIFLSGVFKGVRVHSSSTMATPRSDASLHILFGKAFLRQLERGDIETAKVFARAFLLRPWNAPECLVTVPAT